MRKTYLLKMRGIAAAIMLCIFTSVVYAQNITVRGTVSDTNKEPIIGATIVVKGAPAQGTATDANGKYTLSNVPSNAVLTVTYVGMKPQEVSVKNRTTIDVVLADDTELLSEVVVVGYGTQKKENLTGAVSRIDSKVLESRPLTNLGQGLQGLIPNLNITTGSGRPGQGATFNIRGYTSINGGDPLVMVDGVQMDPNQINPNDVESVTVLKDAAASAIYGGQAAYGVVLITTKKGKKNTPLQINYSYDYAFTRPTRLPNLVSSLDYVTMYKEADETGRATGGGTGSRTFTDEDIKRIKAYMANPTPENSVYIDPTDSRKYRYTGNTDWIKELYPSWEPQQQHNLSLNGGGEKTSYIASFGAFTQKGVLKVSNQRFNRYNASLGLNSEVAKWLDVNFKMTLNRKENDQPANTSYRNAFSPERFASDLSPIMPIRHPDGNFAGQGDYSNPFAIIASGGRNKYDSDDIWLTGGFTLRPLKNVSIVADYTWNSFRQNAKVFVKEFNEYGAVPAGQDIKDPSKAILLGPYPWNSPAYAWEGNNHDIYTAANIYAQYENTFDEKHYVKGMVGYNQETKHFESFSAQVKNLLNQDYPYLKLNNDPKPSVGSGISDWALVGTFFRLNYVYNRKYLLEVNGRYDGSSRFAAASRYVFSPSASLGWRISEEAFFKPLKDVVYDLKFRASYGTLPNQKYKDWLYPYIPTMPYGMTNYIFGNEQQMSVTAPSLVSSDFTWENVTTQNYGVDYSFFNGRVGGNFDYYIRDTKGMIVPGMPRPAILGTSVPERNAADLRTRGFEFEITWRDQLSNGLKYNIGFNLADNRAFITKYDLNPSGNINQFYVGREIGEIWGYVTDGFYATDKEAEKVDNSKLWSGKWLAGDIRFKNLNGDKTADGKDIISWGDDTLENPGDKKIIGNNQARYSYGISLGADYKGFDFSMLAQGVAKRDFMLGGTYFWGFTSQWDVPTTLQTDYWKPDNPNAYYPRQRFGGGGNFQSQTKYLQNGAYMRLKQVTLGYTLPKELTQRLKVNNLRLYVTGQNLFEFTKTIKSYDPEQSNRNEYPINRLFSLGVQIGL